MIKLLGKMRGGAKIPPRVALSEVLWTCLGAAIGIGACSYLSTLFFDAQDHTLIIGPFGATSVLLFGTFRSPLAQPRNVLGGHVLSALIGVASYKLFGDTLWLASVIAVTAAIAAMLITNTLHPPAGASALIAVVGQESLHRLGFLFAFVPVGVGVTILILVALVVNNLARSRRYPEYWF